MCFIAFSIWGNCNVLCSRRHFQCKILHRRGTAMEAYIKQTRFENAKALAVLHEEHMSRIKNMPAFPQNYLIQFIFPCVVVQTFLCRLLRLQHFYPTFPGGFTSLIKSGLQRNKTIKPRELLLR